MNDLYRRLGTEKLENFKQNFDIMVDKYRKMANDIGYTKELKFSKEHGNMVIFVKK
jgi:hypothetical protein